MKQKKNQVIWELAQANDKKNQKSNLIYIFAVAIAVMLLFSAFSIAKGKVDTDSLRNMRKAGTAANVSLQYGTKEQYEKVKKLSYVKSVGLESSFAGIYDDTLEILCYCSMLDTIGYKEMLKPACTDTLGKYPQKEKEIFMSKRALEAIGMTRKQLRKMVYLQSFKKSVLGCFIGGILGILVQFLFIQKLLQNTYLKGFGSANGMNTFYGGILLFSIVFVFVYSFYASTRAMKKLGAFQSIEAAKYQETDAIKREKNAKNP